MLPQKLLQASSIITKTIEIIMRSSSCTLEIDLSKIQQNYHILSEICVNSIVAPVVKANAYGLGAAMVAPSLAAAGAKDFFIAKLEEGIVLRSCLDEAINIYVLNGVFSDELNAFNEYNLIPVLNFPGQVELWQEYASRLNKTLPCVIHINTGMNRLGHSIEEACDLVSDINRYGNLDIRYVMSHLSASEDTENAYNKLQLDKFRTCLSYFKGVRASFTNSSGIFLSANYHFDMVRPGIALYGGNPTPGKTNPMHQAVKLFAPIIQLQNLAPGSLIGYNMTYATKRDTVLATLPVGYADGYSRKFSNNGEVYIGGAKAKIVGRISMDLITVDVTDLPCNEVFVGSQAEIIGDYCTIDKIAAITDTISYEILTQLGQRYKRIYK